MSKAVKIILIIVIADIVLIGGYLGYKSLSQGGSSEAAEEYQWIQIDADYYPQDYIEEYIKNDSEQRGMLPVFIKNYRKDKKILKKFRGRNFAGPSEAQVRMKYRNLEDWQLIELKYQDDNEREVKRAILYIFEAGEWKVGDSGVVTQ